ncbi:hypothetical protein ACIQWA_06765 [Kitasatospora sp. NPDC098652]|uniref:hypothetical protein n=1 Tax=Kitasatospora sp. NPDC098652 TaxID=3364095 RepID=UPI00381FD6E6
MILPLVLLAFAVAAMAVAPRATSRGTWGSRTPRPALLLLVAAAVSAGQALVLAALAAVSAGQALVLAALAALPGGWAALVAWALDLPTAHVRSDYGPHVLLADALGWAVLAWMLMNLVATAVSLAHRAGRAGRKSRAHLRGVAPRLPGERARAARLVVVESVLPVAYCLPGRPAYVVLTTALSRRLTAPEQQALFHRARAQLRGGHHWMIRWAELPVRAFPGVAVLDLFAGQVRRLADIAADDFTARRVGRAAAARLIARGGCATLMVGAGIPKQPGATAERVRRLLRADSPVGVGRRLAASIGAGLLLITPAGLALVPAFLPH